MAASIAVVVIDCHESEPVATFWCVIPRVSGRHSPLILFPSVRWSKIASTLISVRPVRSMKRSLVLKSSLPDDSH